MIETPHAEDAARRVPVYSLYSETREPTDAMLEGLDVLVVDLQDVGTRVYTFIYTMAYCLKAAARRGLPVIVCDRPNPIGGRIVEGPTLAPGFESFVGLYPIALRHGLTIAELARLFNDAVRHRRPLETIAMEGWSRGDWWDATGVPWVMPSPNMPTLDAAVVYPGMVLFEGTLISEGRGTTRPFELVGHPGIDAERFASGLNAQQLPGCISGLRTSSRRSRSTRASPAAAASCTSPIANGSDRWMRPSRCSVRSGTPCPGGCCRGGRRRTSTSTRRCRSTSWPGRTDCAAPWMRAQVRRRSAWPAGWMQARST